MRGFFAKINGIKAWVVEGGSVPMELPPEVKKRFPYVYYLRHADNDLSEPITAEPFCFMNKFGVCWAEEPLTDEFGKVVNIESWERCDTEQEETLVQNQHELNP